MLKRYCDLCGKYIPEMDGTYYEVSACAKERNPIQIHGCDVLQKDLEMCRDCYKKFEKSLKADEVE